MTNVIISSFPLEGAKPQSEGLNPILELSQRMLQLAQIKDWQTLASVEEARRDLIAAFFAQPYSGEAAAAIVDGIREVRALDEQIVVLSEAGRQEVANGMRQLQQAHRAMQAYDSRNGS